MLMGSSFHVDHAAALPYVMEKVSFSTVVITSWPAQTNFKDGNGKVYMTHATKAIYGLTMMDTVRIK